MLPRKGSTLLVRIRCHALFIYGRIQQNSFPASTTLVPNGQTALGYANLSSLEKNGAHKCGCLMPPSVQSNTDMRPVCCRKKMCASSKLSFITICLEGSLNQQRNQPKGRESLVRHTVIVPGDSTPPSSMFRSVLLKTDDELSKRTIAPNPRRACRYRRGYLRFKPISKDSVFKLFTN